MGITGPPERRLADINGIHFLKGGQGEVHVASGTVKFRVWDIRDDCVWLSVNNVPENKDLFLPERQAKDNVQSPTDPKITQFHLDCDRVIQGLQQYKQFFQRYPTGTAAEISKALSSQTEELKSGNKNEKGELVDPWGTPIQFFFSSNTVMIRSAGPNRTFEDSKSAEADDLYRTETK